MIDNIQAPWIIAIHTNMYAGNFEREMSGYVSGIWDNETHGGIGAAVFADEVGQEIGHKLVDKAYFDVSENGHHLTPVTIWPTPGRRNDGRGQHYDEGDSRLKGATWPAYESVAILLGSQPTEEEIDLIWQRALAFPNYIRTAKQSFMRQEGLKVLSMEVIRRIIVVSDAKVAERTAA